MKKVTYAVLLLGVSCMHKDLRSYPQPNKVPVVLNKHGDARTDEYYWLRERENPKVIEHLKKENEFTAQALQSVKDLEENLFKELKSRVKEDESSTPVKDGGYYYAARYEQGQQYPLYVRYKGTPQGPEEVLINMPELAKGHDYFESTGPRMSPNHQILAYAVDTVGRRFFTVYFKDLISGKLLPDTIPNMTSNLTWANDNETIFYAEQNPKTLRSEKIYRYNLRTHKKDLVYHEKDETFNTYVYKSLSKKFIYIGSSSTLTTEVRFVDANKPTDVFRIFNPREREHEYSVTDDGDRFYIITNKNAKNYKLMTAELSHTNAQSWKELIPHRTDTFLQDVTAFKNYLVLDERRNGLTQIHITDKKAQNSFLIPFADGSYMASVGDNREFESEWVRYDYESMRRPPSVYEINMKTREQMLKKTHEVPNYNPELYKTERIFITARDGVKVPVSLVMKKEHQNDGKAPLLIYGYGSYGASMDPWFSSDVFSLVDRGFVFAKAHIRGGSEMGRDWYDTGRTINKKNTFNDFIDCTEALIKNKTASPKRIYAMGGSAGGLLMGAVMNLRPDLYQGIVAQVPFVDVITTMLDDSIPLTTGEYDEWGNPHDKAAYEYIKSYSPYDNVKNQTYPNTLVTTGLHDSQVQYWEPAKWVAKLRDHNQGSSLILLKTDMEAGHGGASGRFDQLKETATEYSFILMIDQKVK
ncbi:MAG: protease 2 [Bdellovibrio sp. ArHS]|uniref:S9 family peptidase n=1 Tax=Bdellovibrio sp. ArHS TaxID=1569284 RepID=UPI000583E4E7|nr:oligopeptidase B [Bdellovibrio sp. ArHS]KHD89270.1 MAG: protease 2 [Bdellovibrio sp. ArHS]